jgi:hypothetical protein
MFTLLKTNVVHGGFKKITKTAVRRYNKTEHRFTILIYPQVHLVGFKIHGGLAPNMET